MKSVRVFECRECPYNEITICRHPDLEKPRRFVDEDNYSYFPRWCPLEDVK